MRKYGDKQEVSKIRDVNRRDYVPWYKPTWLADVFTQRYSPEEKSTVRKVIIPVSSIMNLLKGILK